MKKLEQLGRSLTKVEQKKIMGGTEEDDAGGGCRAVIVCDPSFGCGTIETGSCECKRLGDRYLCA